MECRRGLAMRILSVCLSVWLSTVSVCLSNACIVTKRKKDLSRFLYLTKEHLAEFSEKEATPYTWNFGSTGPRWSEIVILKQYSLVAPSAVTPSEKSSIDTNRKSTTRFPISLRWSSYVAPKSSKRNLKKRKTADFRQKIAKNRYSREESLL